MTKRGRKPLAQVLNSLATAEHPALDDLRALSDLSENRLDEFKKGWLEIPVDHRVEIMTRLGELAEDVLELNINPASRVALDDPDDRVRAAAIRNLWEDQEADLIDPFLAFLTTDGSEVVRAAAATALGIYVYLGEMEELPAETTNQIEDALLKTFHGDQALEVRRRALESLGFSPRPEATAAIDQAYSDGDELLLVSALFAMSRSLNPERWGDTVIEDLNHPSAPVRFEAARAAGELQLDEAVPALGQLIEDADPDVQEMSIWALGEIGGDEARRSLEEKLAASEDDDLSALLEDALANADIVDGAWELGLMGYDEDEDEQARKARLN